jgi:hypothetical protein
MAMTIQATAVTDTSATFTLGGMAANGTVDLQISPDPAFGFCVCPVLSVPRVSPVTISGLNQRATLFARARARLASGAVEEWSLTDSFRTADGAAQDTSPAAVMIEPAVIMLPERVTSWTASHAASGFPAANLGRDAPNGWKAVHAGGLQSITAKLSGAPIDTIAALNTNMPENSQITIMAAPTEAGLSDGSGRVVLASSVPFRASPNLPGRRGYHGLFGFGPVALPWWHIRFEGVKSADTLFVQHLLFGKNRVTKNHSVDKSETPMPLGSKERSRSGVPDFVDGMVLRKVEFDISMLTEAQYETAYGDLTYHENRPVLIVPNSKSGAFLHDRILFGDLKGSRIYNPSSPRFTRTFAVESLI